jgi:hypothetical protein
VAEQRDVVGRAIGHFRAPTSVRAGGWMDKRDQLTRPDYFKLKQRGSFSSEWRRCVLQT